jgi:two-component system, LytTR family, response regulator
MIRTLIVDDELLARKKLRILLAGEPGIEVIAECKTGSEAIAAAQNLKPDLLFLDIQMPEADGFQVLEAIAPGSKTVVIFTTAHDKYAMRAFEAHAFDYLLKPFDQDRIHSAIERVRIELSRKAPDELARHMFEWMAHPDSARGNNQRLVFKTGGRILFLDVDEIDWIEASANYVQLHAGSQSYSLRETIAHIFERLHSWRFVRIHRSLIVNINRIKELQPCNSGEYIVVLKDGKELSCSRGYRGGLQSLIGNL